jgi:hypothetical protein
VSAAAEQKKQMVGQKKRLEREKRQAIEQREAVQLDSQREVEHELRQAELGREQSYLRTIELRQALNEGEFCAKSTALGFHEGDEVYNEAVYGESQWPDPPESNSCTST